LESLELKGDMKLHVSEPSLSRIKISVLPAPTAFGPELQFKQHPNVGKFSANRERIIALKDPSREFPVNQPLGVLKWWYSGKDESYVPLSSQCSTTPIPITT
jgi:coatomer subunit delta